MEFRFKGGTVERVRECGQFFLAGPTDSLRLLGPKKELALQDIPLALEKLRGPLPE